MARETTYLTTGFFFVVFTCPLAYCIRCFNCHLDPENGDCLNAGVLLNARQTFERTLQNKSEKEARLQVADYIAICDTSMDKCVIESILTDGQYKLYYRDCSNGHNFSTDVKSSRLEATPPDNNTHCTYISYIGSMLCVTLCQEDLCNGPALAGASSTTGLLALQAFSFLLALLL